MSKASDKKKATYVKGKSVVSTKYLDALLDVKNAVDNLRSGYDGLTSTNVKDLEKVHAKIEDLGDDMTTVIDLTDAIDEVANIEKEGATA